MTELKLDFRVRPELWTKVRQTHYIMPTATTPKCLMKCAKPDWSFHSVTVEVIKTLMKENREEKEKWE